MKRRTALVRTTRIPPRNAERPARRQDVYGEYQERPVMREWRRLPSLPQYEVSNDGAVRRADAARRAPAGYVLAQRQARDGYLWVQLHNRTTGRPTRRSVHGLVLEAFVGQRPAGYNTNHKDGSKANNCVENLEWVTPRENMLHAYRCGLHRKLLGESAPSAKLTQADVEQIRQLYARGGVTQSVLGRQFGVCQAHISDIITGRRGVWAG